MSSPEMGSERWLDILQASLLRIAAITIICVFIDADIRGRVQQDSLAIAGLPVIAGLFWTAANLAERIAFAPPEKEKP